MQLKEKKDGYTIEFSKEELLVLFEFLADFNNRKNNSLKNSLKTVLYDFECVLESVLEEPFSENYLNLLKNAEERLENICKMEMTLNRSQSFVNQADKMLKRWKEINAKILELEKYYQSPQWKEDYDASNSNQIPKEIPHGVLSEDAVYNLLDEYRQIAEDYRDFMRYILDKND